MEQFSCSASPRLVGGDKAMPLPEDVRRRLAVRAVTDPDVASLMALVTKPDEAASEPLLDQAIEDVETTNNRVVTRTSGRSAA